MKIFTKNCTIKGKTCIALDKKNNKWKYIAHSEAEADLLCDAVETRGWIDDQWWTKA